jgi:hypothetical protein
MDNKQALAIIAKNGITIDESGDIEVIANHFNEDRLARQALEQILSQKNRRSYTATIITKQFNMALGQESHYPISTKVSRDTTIGELVDWYHKKNSSHKFVKNINIHEIIHEINVDEG